MRVVFIDAYNMMHRARYGFVAGPYNVVFNFFRGLRPLIEKFHPDKVYFVLEGQPKERLELYPQYKANRKAGMTPEKELEFEDFKRQREVIYELIRKMPFECIYHPDYECDDVIANLILHRHAGDECIVLSSDTDFIQLYQMHPQTSVYSPVKKTFLLPTKYDYIAWKALVGDASDNISGVPRIGKKTAESILNGNISLWLEKNPEKAAVFHRNVKLIQFADLSEKMDELVVWESEADYNYVKDRFNDLEFYSFTKDKPWAKFVDTFSSIVHDV